MGRLPALAADGQRRGLLRASAVLAVIAFASALAWILLPAADMTGHTLRQAWNDGAVGLLLFKTHAGVVWWVRFGIAAATVMMVWALVCRRGLPSEATLFVRFVRVAQSCCERWRSVWVAALGGPGVTPVRGIALVGRAHSAGGVGVSSLLPSRSQRRRGGPGNLHVVRQYRHTRSRHYRHKRDLDHRAGGARRNRPNDRQLCRTPSAKTRPVRPYADRGWREPISAGASLGGPRPRICRGPIVVEPACRSDIGVSGPGNRRCVGHHIARCRRIAANRPPTALIIVANP